MFSIVLCALGSSLSQLIRLSASSGTSLLGVMDSASQAASLWSNYYRAVTLHGLVMVFFFIMPVLFGGFGNLLLPCCTGSLEVPYPRFNLLSVLILFFSAVSLSFGLSVPSPSATYPGWTLYLPLASQSSSSSILCVVVSLAVVGVSSTLTSVNFMVLFSVSRPSGVTISLVGIYVVSLIVTGLLLLAVLPILLVLLLTVLSDSLLNTIVFDQSYGGDPVLMQHFFWLFGHPEVYIIILPGFGLISACSLFSSLFSALSLYLAVICLSALGFVVWAHHMFASIGSLTSLNYFASLTVLIGVPTGGKVLSWIVSSTTSSS